MSPYREHFTAPVETDRVIFLPIAYNGRTVSSYAAWGVMACAVWIVTRAIVGPVVAGAHVWTLPLGLLAWPLLPILSARWLRRGSLLIGTHSLRQVGLLRERKVEWSDISDVYTASARGLLRNVPMRYVKATTGELRIQEFTVEDANGTLDWALSAATTGRLHEIAERVSRDGKSARRWRWYALSGLLILFASICFGTEPWTFG